MAYALGTFNIMQRFGYRNIGLEALGCTNDYDYSCNHCDETKRNFGASIKLYGHESQSPCWGHTGYMIFQLGNGIYRFSQIHFRYGTTEICGLTWDGERNYEPWDCLQSHGTFEGVTEDLPDSYPKNGGMWCPELPLSEDKGTQNPWKLPVEISLDGKTWTKIGELPFDYWKHATEADLTLSNSVEARFIRIRQPEDVEDKSLCGYLDSIHMNIPDLELVSEDTNIQTETGEITLHGSNCMDAINGYLIGQKTRKYHHTVGDKLCEDVVGWWPESHVRYHFASGSHAATWFAGAGKKWIITRITGHVNLVSYRKHWWNGGPHADDDTCILVIQASQDGVTWQTLSEIAAAPRDGLTNIDIQLNSPVEARFIRVFPKAYAWGHGTIPPSWVVDADLTITSGGGGATTAEITDITWFPDYPDKKLPPDTEVKDAEFTVKNTGEKDGNVTINAYVSWNGSQWFHAARHVDFMNAGQSLGYNLRGRTPSSEGTLHIAITVFGEDEQEPSLPSPQC